MTRKTDSDLDSIDDHWWLFESIRTGAWIISYQSVKSSGRVNGPMALGMSAWYLQFRQERKVWSWHVTEGSLNGCRTRGQKPFTELLMTMTRPYTKTKERVLLGKIEWLLCYSSIVVTEQLVAHSSDVILKGSGKTWRVNSIFLRKRGVGEDKQNWVYNYNPGFPYCHLCILWIRCDRWRSST